MIRTLLLCFCLTFSLSILHAQNFGVITFNIRYDNPGDGPNRWELRKKELAEFLQSQNPGIIGLQEALHHQLLYLDSTMHTYQYVGVGRDDGKNKGEFSPLLIDTSRFSIINSGTFWLSPYPDSVGLKGWDAALPRICTWALLTHKSSGKPLIVFNAHFDHIGQKARKESARLMLKKMKELCPSNTPVVVMGDFNSEPGDPAIRTFSTKLKNATKVSETQLSGPSGTFNGFDLKLSSFKEIDFIFVTHLSVLHISHNTQKTSAGYYLSDHFAVQADLSFN